LRRYNLWLEISAFGSATSSKGGQCPDSGWEFGGSAALELAGFGFEVGRCKLKL